MNIKEAKHKFNPGSIQETKKTPEKYLAGISQGHKKVKENVEVRAYYV